MVLSTQSSPDFMLRAAARSTGTKVFSFDKGHSLEAFLRDAALVEQLKVKYGVRFLPKQVIRRAKQEGFNPLAGKYRAAN